MDKLKIEYWPIEKLVPYAGNPRKNDHAVGRMMEAIKAFGFRIPVAATSDGQLVDGHLRLKAALQMGIKTVPVLLADDLSPEQIKAFRLSVNRAATWAEWDEELLAKEINELIASDFDVSVIGFDQHELDTLLKETLGKTDPDDVPETPAEPVVREGELWLMGKHRLLCGDCLAEGNVERLMGGDLANMVWTDPPYGVAYQGKACKTTISNDNLASDAFAEFLLRAFARMHDFLVPGGVAYVAHADGEDRGVTFREAFIKAGFKLASCLIWVKNNTTFGRSDYHWQHEPILYGWKLGGAHKWYGDRKQSTVIDDVPKPQRSEEHPTMKPVALIKPMVCNSSKLGDSILDLFGGSGSTLIAADSLGRSCRMMEMEPRFAQVIITRWQDFTGLKAVRESDGVAFDEIC